MYRNCIYCAATLGSNHSVEHFPVGRSVAFDGAKGRLWAVCPRCARWNLAPLEERWEAIEEAERLFRDARMRAQSENVGLARLRDGTRLVRIGAAPAGELALWRYGTQLARRHARARTTGYAIPLMAVAGAAGFMISPVFYPVMMFAHVHPLWEVVQRYRRARQVAHHVPAEASSTGGDLYLRWRDLARMRTGLDDRGEPELELVPENAAAAHAAVRLTGPQARQVLGKALLGINQTGAPADDVEDALKMIARTGGADGFVRRVAADGLGLGRPDVELGAAFPTFRALGRAVNPFAGPPPPYVRPAAPVPQLHAHRAQAIALEMALHEEAEREALDGELAALQAMWRQAEEIAAIADRLPDVEPPEPPRITGG